MNISIKLFQNNFPKKEKTVFKFPLDKPFSKYQMSVCVCEHPFVRSFQSCVDVITALFKYFHFTVEQEQE